MTKIHHSTPWSTEKNFGGAINDFCKLVPDNEWICIRDGDTCFLTDSWGSHLEDVIKQHGEDFDLLGCMTNRVGVPAQLIDGVFDNDFDIKTLSAVAQIQETFHYAEVEEIKGGIVAGLLMLFKKSTWKKVGGFDENTKHFDSMFCKKIHKHGGKIGVIKGLYIYHNYRIDCESREQAIMRSEHLGKK
jgi:hypothetical protein